MTSTHTINDPFRLDSQVAIVPTSLAAFRTEKAPNRIGRTRTLRADQLAGRQPAHPTTFGTFDRESLDGRERQILAETKHDTAPCSC